MGDYAKDVTADRRLSEKDESTLKELRATVNELARDLSDVAQKRAQAAKDLADQGTATMRRSIRRQPAMAMGVAAVSGALLAILLVPRASRKPAKSGWADWSPVTRADLHDFADNMQRSMSRAMRSVNSVPLSSSLERMADALSKADQTAGVSSALEKVGSWFNKAQASATNKKS